MDGVWLISSLFVSLWILPRNDPRSWRNSRLLRPSPSFLSNNGSILKKNSIKKKPPSCAPQRSSSWIPVLCPLHPCSTRLLPPCGSLTNPPVWSRGKRYNFRVTPSHLAEQIEAWQG
ncbi:hypothetical protein CCUS01_08352 [Colletotrichum cuscutae]|uniref:Secreted protein n=1 Tax=Colletotrichum cuscutae TaxID=1209917 RepID=A0AAI9USI1_9PEZI|nr:hypothetical protein CCUS01_08352 [Colletotrichum cuscutae]